MVLEVNLNSEAKFFRSYFIDTSNFVDPFVFSRSSSSFFHWNDLIAFCSFQKYVEEFPLENLSFHPQVNFIVGSSTVFVKIV